MAGIARLALIPLALAGAAVPALAHADASATGAAMLGSVGAARLYPFAGSQLDPLADTLNATVAGAPLRSSGVRQVFADGLPVRDVPGVAQVIDANAAAAATGDAVVADEGDLAPAPE